MTATAARVSRRRPKSSGRGNIFQDLANLAVAIPTGWDDGLALAAHDPTFRPFKTDTGELDIRRRRR